MKYYPFIFLLSIAVISCTAPKNDSNNIKENAIITDSIGYKDVQKDSTFNARLDLLLKNLHEPDLKLATHESFRFILWQSLDFPYKLYRVEKDTMGQITLTTKYFLEKEPFVGGTDTIIKEFTDTLSMDEWNTIVDKSLESYFWTLEPKDNPEVNQNDGSLWLIEGKRFRDPISLPSIFKGYSRVTRKTPYPGSFYEFGYAISGKLPDFKKKVVHR